MNDKEYSLTVFISGKQTAKYDFSNFNKDIITVGRNASNDIVITSAVISRSHARIYKLNGDRVIEDLQSTNGIVFNGKKIQAKALRNNDEFTVYSAPGCENEVKLVFSVSEKVSNSGANNANSNFSNYNAKPDGDFSYDVGENTVRMNTPTRQSASNARVITVYEENSEPVSFNLDSFGKNEIIIGRSNECDIVLSSHLVSRVHAKMIKNGGLWKIIDAQSTNGILFNGIKTSEKTVSDGDIIRISADFNTNSPRVLMVFSSLENGDSWDKIPLNSKPAYTIGRDRECDIHLSHIGVSRHHAIIRRDARGYVIEDTGSTNGVFVNGSKVFGAQQLYPGDVISITQTKLIFTGTALCISTKKKGICVDVDSVTVVRGSGAKSFVTCNAASLTVNPGELVAIVGGSGAGKSTLLNAMSGYLLPKYGKVYVNGEDLYANFDSLKSLIGYIPQQDIVFGNLTLHDMLKYTAKLRLPTDLTDNDREALIDKVIATVELTEKKNHLIRTFSGGQKKRASIAVELLSDPNLLYLDEPASGLDPGTERSLMESLRAMSKSGKTIIMVTHSTLQLQMCDKIAFMGKGGNLCFYGSLDEALKFFGVKDVVDIYAMITDNAPYWRDKFKPQNSKANNRTQNTLPLAQKTNTEKRPITSVLCRRHIKLIFNDKIKLLLIVFVAPLLSLLMALVLDRDQVFVYSEQTSYTLFALSCCAIFVGLLNAIQEVCSEREILKREYMAGLNLSSYIMSKVIVMGGICAFQALTMTLSYGIFGKFPINSIGGAPFLEFYLTTFLTMLSSTALGLFVSALVSSSDKAMIIAPILLMPQILFAGMFFELKGVLTAVSWLITCHWSLSSFGSSADINSLPSMNLQKMGTRGVSIAKDIFDANGGNVFGSMAAMLALSILFFISARIAVNKIKNNKN